MDEFLSKNHCTMEYKENNWVLRDGYKNKSSKNGTWYNIFLIYFKFQGFFWMIHLYWKMIQFLKMGIKKLNLRLYRIFKI